MNARILLPLALAAVSLSLTACGNKGPLVLAEPAPVETMPTPPGAVPVTIEPPVTMPDPETEGALRDPTSVNPLLVDPVTGPPPPAAEPYEDDEDDGGDDDASEDEGSGPPPPDGKG